VTEFQFSFFDKIDRGSLLKAVSLIQHVTVRPFGCRSVQALAVVTVFQFSFFDKINGGSLSGESL